MTSSLLINDRDARHHHPTRNGSDDGNPSRCGSFQKATPFPEKWRCGGGRNFENWRFEEQDCFQLTLTGEASWSSSVDLLIYQDSRVGLSQMSSSVLNKVRIIFSQPCPFSFFVFDSDTHYGV